MHFEEARIEPLLVPHEAVQEALAAIGGCRPPLGAANDEQMMHPDLAARLPVLLPAAVAWAREQEQRLLVAGRPLANWQREDARRVGVRHPERVRVQYVEALPLPGDAALGALLAPTGLPGSTEAGLACGYGIAVLRSHAGQRRLLRHQLRHVAQCEAAGSLDAFVADCLRQVAHVGLAAAPFEVDARQHETGGHAG